MYLVFMEKKTSIEPLFAYDDANTIMSLCICLKNVEELILKSESSDAHIKRCYVPDCHFSNANKSEFYALVKIIDNKLHSVLRVNKEHYVIADYYELLEKENSDETKCYKIFEFKGELEE